MNFNEDSKNFWGKLVYTARLTPQNIKSKITSYMFEKSISEIDMVDEFIFHACYFVLNNHKKRILAQAIPSRQADPNGYEVFRFLNIFKFLFPNYIESENYKNFKYVTETGEAIVGVSFAINMVGYTIYSSTKDTDVAKVESNMAFTTKMADVFKASSYTEDDVSRLAFHILESVYCGVEEFNRLRNEIDDNPQLQTLSYAIVNEGETSKEMLDIAVEDYNNSFYAFVESVKQSKNKTLLKIMKDDIITESFTVINEEIKPEIVNYLKLI